MKKKDFMLFCVALNLGVIVGACGVLWLHGMNWEVSEIIAAMTAAMGGVGLILLNQWTRSLERQTDYQLDQIKIQIRKEIDERFNAAIGLMGHAHESVRTGAMCSLYRLAVDDYEKGEKKYCREVPRILCSHIRSVTGRPDYRDEHKLQPSDEIQTAVNLLFKRGGSGTDGLYPLFDNGNIGLTRANLSGAYLVGARFEDALLMCADFTNAMLVRACFQRTGCHRADFSVAHMQLVRFLDTKCHGAVFHDANCQGMQVVDSEFQFSAFVGTQCQNGKLKNSDFSGCDFSGSGFQQAKFEKVIFRGAHAAGEEFNREAWLNMSGKIGQGAQLETMKFDGKVHADAIKRIKLAENMLSAVGNIRSDVNLYALLLRGVKMFDTRPDCYDAERKGIIRGELEDSKTIRDVISMLDRLDGKYRLLFEP